ncbi:MAG: filamentous hemagglutinin N-terminal domain-containing protein, partial [Rubripirellula sp.]
MAVKMKRLRVQHEAATSKDGRIVRIGSASGIPTRKIIIGLQIFLLLMQPCVAFAEGATGAGSVVAGSAAISQAGNTRTIQQFTDRAVINWQDFSIQQGETTRFIQPNNSSVALNRVVGGNPSAILGNLEANGNVFLINPNGIVVGADARINVNGLVASTLDISNKNFMQGGDLNFEGNSRASIINNGEVQALAGDIYLLSASVENHGVLSAENGTVGLAAGQSIQLVDAASPSLVVRATSESLGGTGITNTGLISAMQAELVANGGNVYGLAINNEGVVRANGSENRGGRIFLVSDGGNIRSSGELVAKQGQEGGDVIIHAGGQSGSEIQILGTIDVSGEKYGGTVGMKAASILLGGSNINLGGTIEDGVRLISLGSSSAEIVDPRNGQFLSYAGQNGVTSNPVVDNDSLIMITDDEQLRVQGGSIRTASGDGFTDVVLQAADSSQYISFITMNLERITGSGAPTIEQDATITFEVLLKKPSGPSELVVLEASYADLSSSNKVSIQATGGDLIERITVNSDSNGLENGGTPFISQFKQIGDAEVASGTLTINKYVTTGSDPQQEFEFQLSSADSSTQILGGQDFVKAFLSDGDSESFNLTAGEYNLKEILPAGWFLDSIDIAGDLDAGSTYTMQDASVNLDFDNGEFITVDYTNTQGVQITVAKNAIGPDGSTTDFGFTATGDTIDSTFSMNGG